jgi:hypothetical protein
MVSTTKNEPFSAPPDFAIKLTRLSLHTVGMASTSALVNYGGGPEDVTAVC